VVVFVIAPLRWKVYIFYTKGKMQNALYLIKRTRVSKYLSFLAKIVISLLVLLELALLTPIANYPLPPIAAFMSAAGVAMIVLNLIVSALLFIKGLIENKNRSIRLGTAYFFVAIIFIPLIATLPGNVVPGTMTGHSASFLWLRSSAHIGFGLLTMRYALSRNDDPCSLATIWQSILVVLTTLLLLTLIVTTGLPYLPELLHSASNRFENALSRIPQLALLINLSALLCVVRLQEHRPEQLWIIATIIASCIDVWLTLHGATAFSLAWYCARIVSLITSLTLLIFQFFSITWIYQGIVGANKVLMTLANQDGLTALSNRRFFDQMMSVNWGRARREKQPLALLMIDIDFFKKYNDCYGHLAGDDCLRKVAKHLSQVILRPGDIAARYGGEEFALILPNTDLNGARIVAERLLNDVAAADIAHAQVPSGKLTLSIGVASITPGLASKAASLIQAADQALYTAKESGRNRVCCYINDNKPGGGLGGGLNIH